MVNSEQQEITLSDISIRNQLHPGDIGYLTYLHGKLYADEFDHGISFEAYVAQGLAEFYQNYNPEKDRVWICEYADEIIGSLFLMHKEQAAQLRYFLIRPNYRGLGLGKKLMGEYMDWLNQCGYTSSYLWTTNELNAAASLYKRHGFVLTEEKSSNSFGKTLTEQKYELTISAE